MRRPRGFPWTIGPRILSSVQMAAMAMAPAPTNRTSWENVLDTISFTTSPPVMSPHVSVGNNTK